MIKAMKLLLAFLLIAFSGCASKDIDSTSAKIDGQNMKIVETNWHYVHSDKINFVLKDGKLYGFGGCNRVSSDYKIDGDSIRFDNITSTRKYCNNSSSLESEFIKVLKSSHYFIQKNRSKLTLFDREREPLWSFISQ